MTGYICVFSTKVNPDAQSCRENKNWSIWVMVFYIIIKISSIESAIKKYLGLERHHAC